MRWLLVLLLVFSAPVVAGDLYPCCVNVPHLSTGTVRAWYLHEWPAGQRWYDDATYYAFQSDAEMCAGGEAQPVAFQIFIDDELVKTCGNLPTPYYPIFEDGFDGGDTSQWR